ncbi:4Fe-4S binding protein [Salinivirga cyanobacteriivorans]
MIAKIGGTFLFGRGWCSWACWTTMVMDFFPWMRPRKGRLRHLGTLRYVHFAIALVLILLLWFVYEMKDFDKHSVIELNWLIIGNLFYFAVAIILTIVLKDNRAFCKYVCPIPVLMKFGSRFSIWKIKIEPEKCTECRLCETNCPMNVQLLSYMKNNQRVHSSECIACQQCVNVCPEEAVYYMKSFDCGFKDFLHYRND